PLLSNVRNIATAMSHSCAVAGRFVECWGANSNGQLGRGDFADLDFMPARSIVTDVADAEDVDGSTTDHDGPVQGVTGPSHSCAVLGSGRVYCWGNASSNGLLGPDVKSDAIVGRPTLIEGFSGPAVALASGDNAVCALLRSGAVECWGQNNNGQLGMGSADN